MAGPFGTILISLLAAGIIFLGIWSAQTPISGWYARRLAFFDRSFYQLYVPEIQPRMAAIVSALLVPGLGLLAGMIVSAGTTAGEGMTAAGAGDAAMSVAINYVLAPGLGVAAGIIGPVTITRYLIRRRVKKLEDQIVSGIQTLASGVRAGLNLVQSFQLLERNSSAPLSQEVGQLLREYEHGLTLEQAMSKTGQRIGSPTYRLLFSALETHRIRGGNLGETLDRIADAIREIQRLEKHVETLTAQGRAAARMMGVMPFVILGVLYAIDRSGVRDLFVTLQGRFLLLVVGVIIGLGFWWIRRIVDIDI